MADLIWIGVFLLAIVVEGAIEMSGNGKVTDIDAYDGDDSPTSINPATGLVVIANGIDSGGNPYGSGPLP